MLPFQVVYSPKQVAEIASYSPSARKPRIVAETLKRYYGVDFVDPDPFTIDDFKEVHDPNYVDGIFNRTIPNGFGNFSAEVNESLRWTSGAMYKAATIADASRPACALVSGFHHAGYDRWRGLGFFCTFNGLVATAKKLVDETGEGTRVAILDCDMHWGNGTDDILNTIDPNHLWCLNVSLGKFYTTPKDDVSYLNALEPDLGWAMRLIREFKPDILLYQSGADVHINDPQGGVLGSGDMMERDIRVFKFAKKNKIPVAWCLAGGYQVEPDGSIDKVVELHMNTFKACCEVYG